MALAPGVSLMADLGVPGWDDGRQPVLADHDLERAGSIVVAQFGARDLERPVAKRWMPRFSGVALLGLGVRVAFDRR
jgi:hypothetical protein